MKNNKYNIYTIYEMERFARTISWKCLSKAKRCSLLFRYKQPLVCMSLEEAIVPAKRCCLL